MKLTTLDRRVVKELLTGGTLTQDAIADKIGTPLEAVYKSIQRLKGAGHVELCKDAADARRMTPKLCFLSAFERLEVAVLDILKATV
jgi:DNA-binding Lrp family transcriptional regulator